MEVLIDNSEFIAAHSLNCHTQPQHLHVWSDSAGENYVSYVDDDTFPQKMSVLTLPPSVRELKQPTVLGSSHGLLCVYNADIFATYKMAVLWNPSIRKSITVDMPYHSYGYNNMGDNSYVGFGVCPITSDPKIVSIKQSFYKSNIKTIYQSEVMVYTLSSGKWRNLSTNLPTKPFNKWFLPVPAGGFIYWLGGLPSHNIIVSFDVTNEHFEMIDLPDYLACQDCNNLYICEVQGSLTIQEHNEEYNENNCTVWMMEHGGQKLFTKMLTLERGLAGFRKNGIPIMQVMDDDDEPLKLVVYEPSSRHSNVIGICNASSHFFVESYMETLLLLGRSDCISY